ncbi:hypothetical protein N9Y89_00575 [bacterium]|nr:hypothetical protein [bacterium]
MLLGLPILLFTCVTLGIVSAKARSINILNKGGMDIEEVAEVFTKSLGTIIYFILIISRFRRFEKGAQGSIH